jgi:hypothetical protein
LQTRKQLDIYGFKTKQEFDGIVDKYKASLVIKGYVKKEGIAYE